LKLARANLLQKRSGGVAQGIGPDQTPVQEKKKKTEKETKEEMAGVWLKCKALSSSPRTAKTTPPTKPVIIKSCH
jgi:hypothetical protein